MLDVDVGVLDFDGMYVDADVEGVVDVAVDGRFGILGGLDVGDDCRRELARCISVGELVSGMSVGTETDVAGYLASREGLEDEGWTLMEKEGLELDGADGCEYDLGGSLESGLGATIIAEFAEPELLLVDSSALLPLDSARLRTDEIPKSQPPVPIVDTVHPRLRNVPALLPSCSGKLRSSSTTSKAAPGFITRMISSKSWFHFAQKRSLQYE